MNGSDFSQESNFDILTNWVGTGSALLARQSQRPFGGTPLDHELRQRRTAVIRFPCPVSAFSTGGVPYPYFDVDGWICDLAISRPEDISSSDVRALGRLLAKKGFRLEHHLPIHILKLDQSMIFDFQLWSREDIFQAKAE